MFASQDGEGSAVALTPVYDPVETACASFYFYMWGDQVRHFNACVGMNGHV